MWTKLIDRYVFLKKWLKSKVLEIYLKLNKFQKIIIKKDGQGTTEYAILVGVLVVIAILAIAIFKPKLEELWNAIADGINGL